MTAAAISSFHYSRRKGENIGPAWSLVYDLMYVRATDTIDTGQECPRVGVAMQGKAAKGHGYRGLSGKKPYALGADSI